MPSNPSPLTPLLTLSSPPLLAAALVSLLRSASDRSRRNGAAALKSLAKRDPNAAKAMVSAGAVPALVDLLQVRRDAAPPFSPARPTDPPPNPLTPHLSPAGLECCGHLAVAGGAAFAQPPRA